MYTSRLHLPLIAAHQAQKHITHNEALLILDELTHPAVLRDDLTTPPSTPAEGDRYLVPQGASGAWFGHSGAIAVVRDGAWIFHEPRAGWRCLVESVGRVTTFNGTAWVSSNRFDMLGVNADADSLNRLSVTGPASLFNGGAGGHQIKLNKDQMASTAAVLMQTGFSGRAEIGLTGDDDCHLKVSPDGAAWKEALIADRGSGEVHFPNSPWIAGQNLLVNGDFQINQRGFSGGALTAGSYGHDRWKAAAGGANLSLSGYVVTLNSGALIQIVEPAVWGNAHLAGMRLTLSVDSPTADLAVQIGSTAGTVTAGAGRRGLTIQVAAGDTGNLTVRIAAANAGAVSFGRVKLEIGGRATSFIARPRPLEEQLCYRYFYAFTGTHYIDAFQAQGGYIARHSSIPVSMRTTPSVSFQIVDQYNVDATERGVQVLSPAMFSIFAKLNTTGRGYLGVSTVQLSAEI